MWISPASQSCCRTLGVAHGVSQKQITGWLVTSTQLHPDAQVGPYNHLKQKWSGPCKYLWVNSCQQQRSLNLKCSNETLWCIVGETQAVLVSWKLWGCKSLNSFWLWCWTGFCYLQRVPTTYEWIHNAVVKLSLMFLTPCVCVWFWKHVLIVWVLVWDCWLASLVSCSRSPSLCCGFSLAAGLQSQLNSPSNHPAALNPETPSLHLQRHLDSGQRLLDVCQRYCQYSCLFLFYSLVSMLNVSAETPGWSLLVIKKVIKVVLVVIKVVLVVF